MHKVTREKYALSITFGFVLLIVLGKIYGEITGTEFGSLFTFIISLLFIIPIFALSIVLGYPAFSYLMERKVKVWYFVKIFYSGLASSLVPWAIFNSIFAIVFSWPSSFVEFKDIIFIEFLITMPFVFCSTIIYYAVERLYNKWL